MMTSLPRRRRGYRSPVVLEAEIDAAAAAARSFAETDEALVAVIPAEPDGDRRVYLCAYGTVAGRRWLVLDGVGEPIRDRRAVRDAVAVAAMCELAEESAGGGDVGELRARLVELRLTENPEGIEEAEVAAAELQETLASPPRVASVAYLDAVGRAAARLEQALGGGGSPFAEAMKVGVAAAEDLAAEVERTYKTPLA
jgi:hypothetical protein